MSTSGSNYREIYREFEDEVFNSIVTAFGATAEVMRDYTIDIGSGLKRRVDIAVRKGSDIFLIETYLINPSRMGLPFHLVDRIQKLFTYATLSYGLQHKNSNIHTIVALNINFHSDNILQESNLNELDNRDQAHFMRRWDRFKNELSAVISLYGIDNADLILIDRSDLNNPKKLREKIIHSPNLNLENEANKTTPSKKQEVFISYRRSDSAWASGRLADYLKSKFRDEDIFFDTRNIGLGENFVEAIRRQINASNILLVIIGASWLTVSDWDSGKRRLDDIGDYVRLEISTAFENNLIVIPILLDGVEMPSIDYLPEDISELAYRNAGYLSSSNFYTDVTRIVDSLVNAGVPTKRSRRKK